VCVTGRTCRQGASATVKISLHETATRIEQEKRWHGRLTRICIYIWLIFIWYLVSIWSDHVLGPVSLQRYYRVSFWLLG
jgi:hypothetical protein